MVKEDWDEFVEGNPFFGLFTKLKWVKLALKNFLKKEFWSILDRVKEFRARLDNFQSGLAHLSLDDELIINEKDLIKKYKKLSWVE